MNTKGSLYAVIGGVVGAVLTMAVCSFLPLGAQSQSDGVFGEISCTGLTVRGDITCGGTLIMLSPDIDPTDYMSGSAPAVMILADEKYGGQVYVKGAYSESEVRVIAGKSGGSVAVADAEKGAVAAKMGVDENGGYVLVSDSEKHGGMATMGMDQHGGRVNVFGKGDSKGQAAIGVNEYGNGVVSTWDKNGYRLARLK